MKAPLPASRAPAQAGRGGTTAKNGVTAASLQDLESTKA